MKWFSTECSVCGPGYRSPKAAMAEGPREKLLYVVSIHTDPAKADVLCTVDVDPNSSTYCQVCHAGPFVEDLWNFVILILKTMLKRVSRFRGFTLEYILNNSFTFRLSDSTQTENAGGRWRVTSLGLEYLQQLPRHVTQTRYSGAALPHVRPSLPRWHVRRESAED